MPTVLDPAKVAQYREAAYRKRRERYASDPEFRDQVRAAVRESRRRHPEATRRRDTAKSRKRITGWTQAEYDAAFLAQGGVCRICGRAPGARALCADHCHRTGKKRGLLCIPCNVWIGGFESDPALTAKRLCYMKG